MIKLFYMRFSLVISVLGLSLAVIATSVAQSQPDQSLIDCKNKFKAYNRDLSTLRDTSLRAATHEDFKKADEMKAAFEKKYKGTFGECMKVALVYSKEAARARGVEKPVRSGSTTPSAVEELLGLDKFLNSITILLIEAAVQKSEQQSDWTIQNDDSDLKEILASEKK